MRAKSIILLVLALGCGLVASIGITQVMARRSSSGPAIVGEVEKIFVAMNDIPMGDSITSQMVKLEEWPKDKIQPGTLTKLEDVEGRRPKTKIYAGSPLLDKQLLAKGTSDQGATGLIPKGYRVVPVKVDLVSGGASLIRPGDRVDVLVHLAKNESVGVPETTTRTVLQDIKVFAVDDLFVLESADKEEAKANAKTISLLVKPDQAEMVTLASELGKIRLIMRSPDDDEQPTIAGASPQQIFGNSSGSDRQGESLLQEKPAPSGTADFLKFLAQHKQPANPAPARPETPESQTQSWVMRILAGSGVSEAVLESTQMASASASDSDLIRWTLQTPGTGGGAAPTGTPFKPSHPAAEPTETPQETPVSTGSTTEVDAPAKAAPATGTPTSGSPTPETSKKQQD